MQKPVVPPPLPVFDAHVGLQSRDATAPIQSVLQSKWFILGPKVQAFESAFAQFIGVTSCIGVASGTDALILALKTLDIQIGQTVLTTANAGFYASTAILAVGAVPVYADIDPQRLTLSASALESFIAVSAAKPAAVIVPHLYGKMADIPAIVAICKHHNIPVIEDCAQAHGAMLDSRKAGAWGDIACFSFYPTKNLGGLGDGGALVTSSPLLSERMQSLRQYGWGDKYHVELAGGLNSRLDAMQAAILLDRLPFLNDANAERSAIAQRYNQAFTSLPLTTFAHTGPDDVVHLFVMQHPQRDPLATHLRQNGIGHAVHYPVPDHHQPAYLQLAAKNGWITPVLPETERACAQVLTLPCYPGMNAQQVDCVIDSVRQFFASKP